MSSTFLGRLPTIDLIGFHPTVETLAAQLLLVFAAAVGALFIFVMRPVAQKLEEAATHSSNGGHLGQARGPTDVMKRRTHRLLQETETAPRARGLAPAGEVGAGGHARDSYGSLGTNYLREIGNTS